MKSIWIFFILFCCHAQAATLQKFVTISVSASSGDYSVNALFVTDDRYSAPPLAVISHGSPIDPSYRPQMVPEELLPQAIEFVHMGFATLIVERRGYGRSKEKYVEIVGDCDHRNNVSSGEIASSDILGALDYAQKNLNIDATQIVLVGHSAGGFSSIFASSYGHPGIRAVINFAGGRGAKGNNLVCSESNLLKAYAFAGKRSRIPSLWVYNKNDKAFSPNLAQAMFKAFEASGGIGDLLMLPPFLTDGHALFSNVEGIPVWQPISKQFLRSNNICPVCQ